LRVVADVVQLRVLVRALCDNALAAIEDGGRIVVSARSANDRSRGERGTIEITVSDNGCGIDPAIRDRVFLPFFSGRDAGRGLGMGLAKCWRIATSHRGSIRVLANGDGGTTVAVTLPAAPA
jgi:hypothetical protein